MADTDFMAKLAQQLAFYQNGGKDPGQSFGDRFNAGMNTVNNTISNVLALKKADLENKKAQNDLNPVGSIFGAVPKAQAEAQQSTYVPNNIFPQPNAALESGEGLPQGVQGPVQPQAVPGPAPIAPMVQKRQDVQTLTGLNPDTSIGVAEKMVPVLQNVQYKNALIQNMASGYWQNPDDPTQISATPVVGYVKVKGQQAMMNDLKSQAQDALNAVNEAKIKAAEAKEADTKIHYERLAQLNEERNKILSERIAAMEAKTVQAASTKAATDKNSFGGQIRNFLGIQPKPSEYLNSAGGQQPAGTGTNMPTATDANGKKVMWNGSAWVPQ